MIRSLIPFGSFDRMENEFAKMERLINDVFSNGSTFWSSDYSNFPRINIVEDANRFIIEAGLAGYNKEDVKITLTSRGLKISGKQKESSEIKSDNAKYHLKEMTSRAFEKLIIIPETVEKKLIKSKLKDGILIIELPKKDAQNDTIELKID